MPTFDLAWKAYGTLRVEADDEREAHEYAAEALFSINPMDVERIDVDGVDTEVA